MNPHILTPVDATPLLRPNHNYKIGDTVEVYGWGNGKIVWTDGEWVYVWFSGSKYDSFNVGLTDIDALPSDDTPEDVA